MSEEGLSFNPPPGWPRPPDDWVPPAGWTPDPSWPSAPEGWQLWIPKQPSEPSATDIDHKDTDRTPQPQTATNNLAASYPEIESRLRILEAENQALRQQLSNSDHTSDELVILDDETVLQSVGIYRYHHPLENSTAYKVQLDELGAQIASLVKGGNAIEMSNTFTFDNSLAKGRRMTADLGKLMLRAYNAESDNSIRALRVGNVLTAKKRLEASRTAIAKLGAMMEMHISDSFHELRLEEIELTADWLMRKQAEKEDAREERARLREEKRAEKELAQERERLDKERSHIEKAIAALLKSGLDHDPELEARLTAIDSAIEENDFRIANIRAGYVYVISNRGAFGSRIVKIGLTRRLEPLDRIRELSGAAVPFQFDIHALYFSEDAVTLETELHHHFANRAVNMANSRKEFFFATPTEVREALIEKVGNLLEFTEKAEATEYLQSMKHWPDDAKRQ